MSPTSISRSNSHDQLLPNGHESSSHPKDRAGFIWLGFLIMGITTLVPWNSFVTDTDYWMYKFRNVTDPQNNQSTSLQIFFESYLSIASTLPIVVAMVLTSLFGQRFKQKSLINVPLTITFICFAITTALAIVNTDHIQYIFLALTIIMVTIIGFLSAVFQAALFGYTANFPSHCMHAMVSGQAVAGLLITIIQIITLAANFSPKVSGLTYFAMSTSFIIIALTYYQFMDNDYTRHYTRVSMPTSYVISNDDEGSPPDSHNNNHSNNLFRSNQELIETIKDCWKKALTIVLVFVATLSVFPAVCVLVRSQHPDSFFLTAKFFTPIMAFLIYNVSDLLGRVLSTMLPWPSGKQDFLLFTALGRIIIPLMILFCNVEFPNRSLPILLDDAYFGLLVALTGLTQGYLFSSAMVLASIEAKPTRRELTGFIMATCLGTGLALGSLNSTLLISLLKN